MAINKVAILGAGAVGAYFVWGLSDKLGDNLVLIAKGDRKEQLENEGLVINGRTYKPKVCEPQEAQNIDLLFVAVKDSALPEVLEDIVALTNRNTTVMSLLNGVDSEETIAGKIGEDHVLPCFMKIASQRNANIISFDGEATAGLYFGETTRVNPSVRMLEIALLMEGTPLHYHFSEDIMSEMWAKYVLNISRNLPQAIVNCGGGAYLDSVHINYLAFTLRNEALAVAQAKGIDMAKLQESLRGTGEMKKTDRWSTLQDLDAKRHTEIDMFSGRLVQMGKEVGVATPCNEFCYHIIKALEEKNDGKFDYE